MLFSLLKHRENRSGLTDLSSGRHFLRSSKGPPWEGADPARWAGRCDLTGAPLGQLLVGVEGALGLGRSSGTGAGVPEDGWRGRAMSGSDKSWVCVCTLLESHVNEQNIPGKIP